MLSRLSVRGSPESRLRLGCSSRYLRISPLLREFHSPLLPSSPPVSHDPSQLSREISHETWWAAYSPFTPSKSGQRSPPTSYRGCWHVVSRGLFLGYRPYSSPRKGVYNPKAVFPHAVSLRQAFAHCARFPAAASRRSGGRVSVPLCPSVLSHRVPVFGLVGHYPTNYLIGRKPVPKRLHRSGTFPHPDVSERAYGVLGRISPDYPPLRGWSLTCYSAVCHYTCPTSQTGTVRLACIKRTASVRPEPGSNSS